MAAVRARGLVKTFGSGRAARRVLDGADLDVEPGEVIAVLGRSGTGKSTLLHLIGGLDRADAGSIEVAGEDVATASEAALSALRRREIGFVFQFFHLLPELSGEGNVLLAGRVRGAHPRAAARGGELIDSSGCGTSPGRFPTSSPAASSSASPSPARSSTTRRCSSRTSRPATSTPRPAPRSCGCCAPAPTRAAPW
jgi:ABC-type lipoprotein export system ATPase subunit